MLFVPLRPAAPRPDGASTAGYLDASRPAFPGLGCAALGIKAHQTQSPGLYLQIHHETLSLRTADYTTTVLLHQSPSLELGLRTLSSVAEPRKRLFLCYTTGYIVTRFFNASWGGGDPLMLCGAAARPPHSVPVPVVVLMWSWLRCRSGALPCSSLRACQTPMKRDSCTHARGPTAAQPESRKFTVCFVPFARILPSAPAANAPNCSSMSVRLGASRPIWSGLENNCKRALPKKKAHANALDSARM